MEYSQANGSPGRWRWSPYPPTVPGIYLYCKHQGAPVTRMIVEWWYGKLAARPIDGDESAPVRRMTGWWYLEEAVIPEKQVMETEGADAGLLELEWLP